MAKAQTPALHQRKKEGNNKDGGTATGGMMLTTIHPVLEDATVGKTNSAAHEWLPEPHVAPPSRCLFWYLALEVEIGRKTILARVDPTLVKVRNV